MVRNRNRRRGVKKGELDKEFAEYYMKIGTKPKVYIEVDEMDADGHYHLNLTNLIVLFMFERYNWSKCFTLFIVMSKSPNDSPILKYKTTDPDMEKQFTNTASLPNLPQSCHLPSLYFEDKKLVISGLTSLLRFLLKYSHLKFSQENDSHQPFVNEIETLLGFRGGCLAACAEASLWTAFCEIEMTQEMVSKLQKLVATESKIEVPEALLRFEYHLSQPVRIHNFRKIIQDRKLHLSGLTLDSSCSKQNRIPETIDQLNHDYAEGPHLTLSDMILYPAVKLSLLALGTNLFEAHLPKSLCWFNRMEDFTKNSSLFLEFASCTDLITENLTRYCKVTIPEVPFTNLYKSDSPREKWKTSEYTKQEDVEEAVQFLISKEIHPEVYAVSEACDPLAVDWDSLPGLVHPEGGELPASRKNRKCEQLANLIEMVRFVIQARKEQESKFASNSISKTDIVDFCSGGGHLGILVAWLLPNVNLTLVENKEESLRRAQIRVEKIGLENISLLQCNLTSFRGTFDIGLALHACGSSTDLVLQKCEASGASFVVSPCCYGSIQNNHLVQYPRSTLYKNTGLTHRQYFVLTHSSDQTHDEKNAKTSQGQVSMQFVDGDRLEYFKERGYDVFLKRMVPHTASPKNHILVGRHPLPSRGPSFSYFYL